VAVRDLPAIRVATFIEAPVLFLNWKPEPFATFWLRTADESKRPFRSILMISNGFRRMPATVLFQVITVKWYLSFFLSRKLSTEVLIEFLQERVMNASVSALTATYGTVYEYGDFATLLCKSLNDFKSNYLCNQLFVFKNRYRLWRDY
jgi:hypothetical protein